MTIAGLTAASVVTVGAVVASGGTAAIPAALAISGAATNAAAVGAGAAGVTAVASAATATGVASAAAGVASTGLAAAGGLTGVGVQAGILGTALGPVGTLVFCFHPSTVVTTEKGSQAMVSEMAAGDKILAPSSVETLDDHQLIDVTNVTTLHGTFSGHEMIFENGQKIIVSSTHYMIVFRKNQSKIVSAESTEIGDYMYFKDGKKSRVVVKSDLVLSEKVNIETKSGLMFANDIFTTGICEFGPSQEHDAEEVLKKYRDLHAPA